MIFDELWRAERHAMKVRKQLKAHYQPLIDAAKKKNDDKAYQLAVLEYRYGLGFNNEPEIIRTARLIERARKVGLLVHRQNLLPMTKKHWKEMRRGFSTNIAAISR